jgi:hypothetical protein
MQEADPSLCDDRAKEIFNEEFEKLKTKKRKK